MPYTCCNCENPLTGDFLLGQPQGTFRSARVCGPTCSQAWQESRFAGAECTWRTLSEWLQATKGLREGHPKYKLPASHVALWRYMDLAKFVRLADTKALFLPRASLFQDPFEGSVSLENLRLRQQGIADAGKNFRAGFPDHVFPEDFDQGAVASLREYSEIQARMRRWSRDWTYVSCWHVSEHESAAMWGLYGSGAIAIKTRLEHLLRLVDSHFDPNNTPIVSLVNYLDYATEPIAGNYVVSEFLHKRKSFEHERELRVIVQRLPHLVESVSGSRYDHARTPIDGIEFEFDPQSFLEEIYVASDAPAWMAETIERMLPRYNISAKVIRSRLNDPTAAVY